MRCCCCCCSRGGRSKSARCRRFERHRGVWARRSRRDEIGVRRWWRGRQGLLRCCCCCLRASLIEPRSFDRAGPAGHGGAGGRDGSSGSSGRCVHAGTESPSSTGWARSRSSSSHNGRAIGGERHRRRRLASQSDLHSASQLASQPASTGAGAATAAPTRYHSPNRTRPCDSMRRKRKATDKKRRKKK